MKLDFRYKAAGDSAILMELDAGIDEKTNKRIIHLSKLIEDKAEEGFGEVIIGYRSILVQYNPLRLSYQQAVELLKYLETNNDSNKYEKEDILKFLFYMVGNMDLIWKVWLLITIYHQKKLFLFIVQPAI